MNAILLILALVAAALPASSAPAFHVAPGGNDGGPGSARRPFATLERARKAVRALPKRDGARVMLHAGAYERTDTFELTEADGGTPGRPVVWEAAPSAEVRLLGGRVAPASLFRPASDAAIVDRLDPAARGHVLVAGFDALGLKGAEPFPTTYHGAPPGPELFFNGERLRLACWPNKGWAHIARVVDPGSEPREGDTAGRLPVFAYDGDRPSRWKADAGVWLQGYWRFDWYDQVIKVGSIDAEARTITLAAPHVYSLKPGNPSPRRFRALNVLEELDEPGEFVVDVAGRRVFLWPPTDPATARVEASTLNAPVIALRGASNLVIRGIAVECGLDLGIEVQGGAGCVIDGCRVLNLRHSGIRVTGGERHRVQNCDIHDTGTGGLEMQGGDRKTLQPAGHQALNNHVWRFSMHQFTSAYGLILGGVGNRAANNLIHDAPHQAVSLVGNDHIFELNEVHSVCMETDDCGALYKGRNPSCRGNLIRWNYWHDIGSPMGHGNAAVYFDDGDGGDTVLGNVFVRCGDPGIGSFGTVFSHGGHDIRADNNLFVECKRALGSAPWDYPRWLDAVRGGQDCFFTEKLLKEVDITRPPYTTRYPELAGFMEPKPETPRVNRAARNILVRCGQVSGGAWELEPGSAWSTNEDPGFVNMAAGNYALKKDAEAFRRVPGFQTVPFGRMGLQRRPSREQTAPPRR